MESDAIEGYGTGPLPYNPPHTSPWPLAIAAATLPIAVGLTVAPWVAALGFLALGVGFAGWLASMGPEEAGAAEAEGPGGWWNRFSLHEWGVVATFLPMTMLLFAALRSLAAYDLLRPGAWPSPGPEPLGPGLAVLVLVGAAVLARRAAQPGHEVDARVLGAATLLGVLFLVGTIAAWAGLMRAGFHPGMGPEGSLYFWVTGVHAVFVFAGVLLLGALAARALRHGADVLQASVLRAAAAYWGYIAGAAVVLWVLVVWQPFALPGRFLI